jgi:hypothetical protein
MGHVNQNDFWETWPQEIHFTKLRLDIFLF